MVAGALFQFKMMICKMLLIVCIHTQMRVYSKSRYSQKTIVIVNLMV